MNGPELSTAAIPELVLQLRASASASPFRVAGNPAHADAEGADDVPADTPDAEIAIADGLVRVHAMFRIDPTTNEVQVSVVDDRGRLIRMIPPDSVSQMLQAMAAYANRL